MHGRTEATRQQSQLPYLRARLLLHELRQPLLGEAERQVGQIEQLNISTPGQQTDAERERERADQPLLHGPRIRLCQPHSWRVLRTVWLGASWAGAAAAGVGEADMLGEEE